MSILQFRYIPPFPYEHTAREKNTVRAVVASQAEAEEGGWL